MNGYINNISGLFLYISNKQNDRNVLSFFSDSYLVIMLLLFYLLITLLLIFIGSQTTEG